MLLGAPLRVPAAFLRGRVAFHCDGAAARATEKLCCPVADTANTKTGRSERRSHAMPSKSPLARTPLNAHRKSDKRHHAIVVALEKVDSIEFVRTSSSEPRTTTMDDGTKSNGILHLKNGIDYINPGEEDQMEIYGYKRNKIFTAITWFLIIITGGLLRLVFHWIPHLMLLATHSKCQLENADTVLLVERFQGKHTSYHVKN